jgi:biofilm PGA synthesis N-glycosyltransferase PgaC
MITAISIILVSYFLSLLLIIFAWRRMVRSKDTPAANHTITVLVAIRNEEKNIQNLLSTLNVQDHTHYEVILIDDHSEDATEEVVATFFKYNKGASEKMSFIKNEGTGKKAALTTGVIHARGEIIVTTDGDCLPKKSWLKNISNAFTDEVNMVTGGVRIKQTGTLFADMQAIEFASLIGSSAASIALNRPTMCNAANLGFRKSVFIEVGGYQENMHIASGDDEFLMRKINDRYPGSIRFLHSSQSVVETSPSPTVREFFQQRVRWAGKWRFNTSAASNLVAFYVLIVQGALLTSFILLLSCDVAYVFSLLLIRLVLEFWFLYLVARFLDVRWNLLAFLMLQFLYPWYVVFVGTASRFMPYTWKERRWRQSVS